MKLTLWALVMGCHTWLIAVSKDSTYYQLECRQDMWPALIAAGAQLAGGLLNRQGQQQTNAANAAQVAETNQFNAAEAQKNRDFQERMSDTQWQRGVADMEKAGLNPALAYQQGGAGTPSGSSASGQVARMENPNTGIAGSIPAAVSSALDAMNTMKDLELKDQQKANITADTANKVANTTTTDAMREGQVSNLRSISMASQARSARENIESDFLSRTMGVRQQALEAQLRSLITNANESSARTKMIEQGLMDPLFRKYVAPWLNDASKVGEVAGKAISAAANFSGAGGQSSGQYVPYNSNESAYWNYYTGGNPFSFLPR